MERALNEILTQSSRRKIVLPPVYEFLSIKPISAAFNMDSLHIKSPALSLYPGVRRTNVMNCAEDVILAEPNFLLDMPCVNPFL